MGTEAFIMSSSLLFQCLLASWRHPPTAKGWEQEGTDACVCTHCPMGTEASFLSLFPIFQHLLASWRSSSLQQLHTGNKRVLMHGCTCVVPWEQRHLHAFVPNFPAPFSVLDIYHSPTASSWDHYRVH